MLSFYDINKSLMLPKKKKVMLVFQLRHCYLLLCFSFSIIIIYVFIKLMKEIFVKCLNAVLPSILIEFGFYTPYFKIQIFTLLF